MRVHVRPERRPRTPDYFARDGDPRPPRGPSEIREEGGRGARERQKGRPAEEAGEITLRLGAVRHTALSVVSLIMDEV